MSKTRLRHTIPGFDGMHIGITQCFLLCSHLRYRESYFRRSGLSFFYRELSFFYRMLACLLPGASGHVVSRMRKQCVSAGQSCHPWVVRKYSPEVTTRDVVTPDYMVTTCFSRLKNIDKRRSDAMLTTRKRPMQLLSGSNFRLATLFHGLPLNTTFSQVRSGVSVFSTHHFVPQNNAPLRIFLP